MVETGTVRGPGSILTEALLVFDKKGIRNLKYYIAPLKPSGKSQLLSGTHIALLAPFNHQNREKIDV